MDAETFIRFFESIKGSTQPHIINTKEGQEHSLGVRNKFLFTVTKAHRLLTEEINSALQNYVIGEKTDLVPYDIVDTIIATDYKKKPSLGYTIYVLNPKMPSWIEEVDPTSVEETTQKVHLGGKDILVKKSPDQITGETQRVVFENYAYNMPPDEETRPPPHIICPFSLWAGQERYAWIDLTAGPVDYGPQTSGDGIVSEYALPRLSHYMRGNDPQPSKDFVADIVTLVRRTCEQLISPSLAHFPIPDAPEIYIHLFVINDHSGPVTSHFDWQTIEKELMGLTLLGQKVEFGHSVGSFLDCELCVAAYSHSLKSHTSNIRLDGLRTQVHQYLDSKSLHDWLEHFDANFWGITPTEENIRVIPVFLYDLAAPNIILLDRFHQAVSFPDMVIAVQTQVNKALVDFACKDKVVSFNMKDSTRAVMSALLQTVYGVAPTQQRWSPLHNATLDDFLWAVGNTPFGLFSYSKKLSFAQRDAAARNLIYTHMSRTLTEVSTLLHRFAKFGKELDEVLSPAQYTQFVQRWNVFKFKLEKATTLLSFHNYNHSLYHLRSLAHDVRVIGDLIYEAGNNMRSFIHCFKGRRPLFRATTWVGVMLMVLAGMFLWYRSGARRDDTIHAKKRYQRW
eukprot:TRINITY_DN1058_c0_g1_i1.p1 TRINITY_DN1058_c0_g1~~TRINITY_DN1058_c0_g1_i1.p1  ORF type:complete len:727 (+),score=124.16 TRINITY_DN1058_c0_g1_i1:317-2182(+)